MRLCLLSLLLLLFPVAICACEQLPTAIEERMTDKELPTVIEEGTTDKELPTAIEERTTGEEHLTITAERTGQLAELLPDSIRYTLSSLTVAGVLNNDDLLLLDSILRHKPSTEAHSTLKVLNLTDVLLVAEENGSTVPRSALPQAFFSQNTSIEKVFLPKSLLTVSADCFSGCSRLKEIRLPEEVNAIGDFAFTDCTSLTAIQIPASVREIGSHAFEGCAGLKTVTIPEGVVKIGTHLFKRCLSLDSAYIKSTVNALPDNMFQFCSMLRHVELPPTLTTVGDGVFENTLLHDIKLPEGCHTLGSAAFRDCRQLNSVVLPKALRRIGGNAFSRCVSLRNINVCSPTPPAVSHSSFKAMIYAACRVTVPKGSKNSYGRSPFWKRFRLTEEDL